MKHKSWTLMAGTALVLALSLPLSALAQAPDRREGRLNLGAEIGFLFGTADSTAFGLAMNGDYFLNQNLSVGPLVQFGLTDDLFQFGPSVQFKHTYDIDQRLSANLQAGIGFIYAELDSSGSDRDDTSYLIPVGGGLEYKLGNGISLGTTVLFNFMDLDEVRGENFYLSLLGGLKVRF